MIFASFSPTDLTRHSIQIEKNKLKKDYVISSNHPCHIFLLNQENYFGRLYSSTNINTDQFEAVQIAVQN